MKEIIVLPYNERIAPLLDLEKWFNVRSFEAEKLKTDLRSGLRPPLKSIDPNLAEEAGVAAGTERAGKRDEKREIRKIVLSRRWGAGALFYLALMVLVAFAMVGFYTFSRYRLRHLLILFAGIYELMLCGVLLGFKRRATYAKIYGDEMTAYSLFGRRLCTIHFNNPIYFAIFEAPSVGLDAYCIALSEASFAYKTASGTGKIKKDFFSVMI